MFRWFESRIDTFPDEPPARPPETLLAFYLHFVRPVWPAFALLLVAGLLGSLIEVALLAFVGSLVDMMRGAQSPAQFFAEHGTILLTMAFIALIARPVVSTAHELIKNQIIAAPVTTRVRWLTHRYVLRQSLGFFQNDFAGRVANKVMQAGAGLARVGGAGDRRHLVRGRAVDRRGRDLRRRRLAPADPAARLARRLHRALWSCSCRASRSAPRRRRRRAPCWLGASSTATPTSSPSSSSPTPSARTTTRAPRWRSRWRSGRPRCASSPSWTSCSTRSTACSW